MKKRILVLLMGILSLCQLQAQNWDINTVKTINDWGVHDLSRGLSHSGILLPVPQLTEHVGIVLIKSRTNAIL